MLKLFVDAMAINSLMGGLLIGSSLWAFGLFLQLPHIFYEHRSLILMLVHEMGHFLILILISIYYAWLASIFKDYYP